MMYKPTVLAWISITALLITLLIGLAITAEARADHTSDTSPADIVRDPTDLPPPIGYREPKRVRVDLETIELIGQLDVDTIYYYWTFNGKIPGPFIRVRVDDTVEVHLHNANDSIMNHSVDFHAVSGPGGGGTATLSRPGEQHSFTFKALRPGLYVYHCATPSADRHIANGMYGMILVEPREGLPPVDREFYVMQGEIYTKQPMGTHGEVEESIGRISSEKPEYIVFNGAVGALKTRHPLSASVGETIRVYFGVGGPNLTSSFHVIGGIFSRVWPLGALSSPNLQDVQTVTVPPGGAAVVDLSFPVPGQYLLVDHALSRINHGLVGLINVEGPQDPSVFSAEMTGTSTTH